MRAGVVRKERIDQRNSACERSRLLLLSQLCNVSVKV
jgi:hypothetical protein